MNLRVTMSSEVKGFSPVSVVKASLNRAYSWDGVDAKPSDLHLTRLKFLVTQNGGPHG